VQERACLRCREPFKSKRPGHRMCNVFRYLSVSLYEL